MADAARFVGVDIAISTRWDANLTPPEHPPCFPTAAEEHSVLLPRTASPRWDYAPGVRDVKHLMKKYARLAGGCPGCPETPKFREICTRIWLDLLAHLGTRSPFTGKPLLIGNDLDHRHNLFHRPWGLCVMEPSRQLGGSYEEKFSGARRWLTKVRMARNRQECRLTGSNQDAARCVRGGRPIDSAVGVLAMAPGSDLNSACARAPCLENVTFAAASILTRNMAPAELRRPLRELMVGPKTRGAVFLTRHQTFAQTSKHWARERFKERWIYRDYLERVLPVEMPVGLRLAAGGFANRSRHGGTICEFSESTLLFRPYVFALAFENSNSPQWVTERIVSAFMAGTVPIYWGTRDVFRYFNPRAMIYANDLSPAALAARVGELWRNCSALGELLQEPPCTEQNLRNLFWWRDPTQPGWDQPARELPRVPCREAERRER
eukprot:TRINITY_DN8775_c0_g1_i1.p1 TRINITY_DN8775_c0_g1~~TRINITY_DN8775_c0_g1_i1.p1  ORF type:complete len:495 (+),score=153.70 TRINITY_DN8775_c0_g1_i1:179-1486(+)